MFQIIKIFEQRQALLKKFFVRGAVVGALPCAPAAACPAKAVVFAFSAFFRHVGAALYKIFRRFAKGDLIKRAFVYIAKQIFIRTVKIAGVDVAVALANELPCAKAAHAALLSRAAQIKANPVVKLPNAYVPALL